MLISHDHDKQEVHIEGVDTIWGLLGCKPGIPYAVFMDGKHVGSGMRKERNQLVHDDEASIELEYRPIQPLSRITMTVELE